MDEPTIQSYIETREIVGSAEAGIVSNAETLAAKLSLLKATAEYDLKRVISFHGRVTAARDFASEYSDLIDLVEPSKRPKGLIWTDFVSGEMSAGDRKQKIQKLKKLSLNERGLLANARCLSEGVDVPSRDGVAFIDPKGSQIDIIQAVGRALRKSDEKKFGTIILPVFIEPGDNEIERIESSNFKPVWDVLKALRSHDERLGESIDGIRTELGKRQKTKRTLPDNSVFDLPVNVGIEFSESLQTRLIESVSESWYFWCGLFSKFVAEKNHCSPLAKEMFDGHRLGAWVHTQRQRRMSLSHEKVIFFESFVDWSWTPLEDSWNKKYRELAEIALHSQTKVLVVPSGNTKLSRWVQKQRGYFLRGVLEPQRIKLLEALNGWSWSPDEDKWYKNFQTLEKLAAELELGNITSTFRDDTGFGIGAWRLNQISNKKLLSSEQKALLEQIPGWKWEHEDTWQNNYENLIEFLDLNDGRYPSTAWTTTMRENLKLIMNVRHNNIKMSKVQKTRFQIK